MAAVVFKPELLRELAARTSLSQGDCARVLDSLADVLIDSVAAGDEVRHPRLGIFRPRLRRAREFKSEISGRIVQQAAFLRLVHVPSAEMKRRLRRAIAK